jgi:hypothetical protein
VSAPPPGEPLSNPPPPQQPPPGYPPGPVDPKPPFAWRRFFLGVAVVPASLLVIVGLSALTSGLSNVGTSDLFNNITGGISSLLLIGSLVTGFVLVFLPKWREIGAGILSGCAVTVIIAGAACVALIVGLASMYN